MTPTRQRPDGTEAQVETPDRISSNCETRTSFSPPPRRFPLSISGLCAIALAACALLPAQAKEKIVGVPGWTTGSQTYLRARPSAEMPAVAKVPRHTRLYVWGKFDGWYRVETPDGKFGWVYHPFVNAPSIEKVAELSHRKARAASNRTADQKLYGDAQTMRNYRDTYGHLVSETEAKPRAATARLATARKRSSTTRISSTRSVRDNVKSNRKIITVATTKVVAPKVAVVKVSTPRVSAPRVFAPRTVKTRVMKTRIVEVSTRKVETRVEATARIEKAALLAQQAEANRQARLAQSQNEAKLRRVAAQERETNRLNAQKYAYQQRVIAEQKRMANAQIEAQAQEAAKTANRQRRIARLEREKQARAARYQKRLATRQANRRARLERNLARVAAIQKREKERAKLAAFQQGAPTSSTRSSSIAVAPSDVALRPISPQELQKAREQYLNSGRRASSNDAASADAASNTSTSSPLNKQSDRVTGFEQSSYTKPNYEVRGKITVTPASQMTTKASGNVPQGLTLSLGASPAKSVTVTKVVTATSTQKQSVRLASRGNLSSRGGSPMMRAGMRGGSPRDYARYRAQGSLFGQSMTKQALTYRGRPYIMGAASPSRGFDCSGLIYFLLRQRGYNPPRTAAGLSRFGASVPRNDLQPGDILLFANTYKRGISHAGIYMGNGKFVHAANRKRGVATDAMSSRYWASKYWGARRVK